MEADDNKTDNRLSEPEVAYERTPKASVSHSRKTVNEMVDIIRREHPCFYAEMPDLRERLDTLEHPRPLTKREARQRIEWIQEEIDAGCDSGITWEKFQAEMEEEFPELKHRYPCG